MEEIVKVDKEYLKAFNLGYELAKELNIKSPMFKDLNSGNIQMQSIQAGMAEFYKELKQGKLKGTNISSNLVSNESLLRNNDLKDNKGKGFDISH